MATEARGRPQLLADALEHLVRNSYSGFERWLQCEADIPAERAEIVTAIGLGALLSSQLMPTLFGVAVTGCRRRNVGPHVGRHDAGRDQRGQATLSVTRVFGSRNVLGSSDDDWFMDLA
jgi:hypothetical protein